MNAMPTVFVVDDDQAVRDAISLLLRADGLAVATFASAAAFWNPPPSSSRVVWCWTCGCRA